MGHTKDFGCGDLIENFHGKTLLEDEVCKKINEIIEDYNDYIFWNELEVRTGKRDFERTITEEEKKYIKKNNDWLPERINELYDKYRDEFEKYGINRLEIKNKDN